MKGDQKIVEYLNKSLKRELTAINQFFLHSRMLHDWGVSKLGTKEYNESIEEMNHADRLIQRVLFLEGVPNLQDLDKLMIGENVKEILELDLKLEYSALPELREAIPYAEKIGDFPSRDLFQQILRDEEEHIDYLETQLDLLERVGVERYTQLNAASADQAE
ncbi:bacterioferritin [Limimonas halophila]|uniref:Bacterioferritin n=1 Tax=Limimonas halophila TaxID=1082479 RepID=A0A1G7NZD2_9PROT|nr:bacterioferritin [Limimonas halophila]SDF79412.1 bacterioferritin [Limimonas halophila]